MKERVHYFRQAGITIATITDDESDYVKLGYAQCSRRDMYCKKIARDVALGRARKERSWSTVLQTVDAKNLILEARKLEAAGDMRAVRKLLSCLDWRRRNEHDNDARYAYV